MARTTTLRNRQKHPAVREGLQIVDREHLSSGIHMFNYIWVGHAPRDCAPSLCFIDYHDSISQTPTMNTSKNRVTLVDRGLLSIGIELAIPISAAFRQLRACGAMNGIPITIYPSIEQFVNGTVEPTVLLVN